MTDPKFSIGDRVAAVIHGRTLVAHITDTPDDFGAWEVQTADGEKARVRAYQMAPAPLPDEEMTPEEFDARLASSGSPCEAVVLLGRAGETRTDLPVALTQTHHGEVITVDKVSDYRGEILLRLGGRTGSIGWVPTAEMMSNLSRFAPVPTVDDLGSLIWETSRRDEGTISYTGARHIAETIHARYYAHPPVTAEPATAPRFEQVTLPSVARALEEAGYGPEHGPAHMRIAALAEDRDRLESNLATLLCDLTDGRMSKTNYDVRTMIREVEAAFERHAEEEAADLRAEVERYKAALEAAEALIETQRNARTALVNLHLTRDNIREYGERLERARRMEGNMSAALASADETADEHRQALAAARAAVEEAPNG